MALSSEELIARIEMDVKEIKTSLASFREEWMKDQFSLRNDMATEQNQTRQRLSLFELEHNALKLSAGEFDKRLKALEGRPLKTWDSIKAQMTGLVVTGIGGALLGYIISRLTG